MKTQREAKRWFYKCIGLIAGLLVVMMGIAYLVDPFLYYRVGDHKYWLNSRYVTKGLLEHEEYDTVIIGSSMVQNFRIQSFRDKLGYEPVKATIGAMNLTEMKMVHQIALEQPQTKRIILNLDLAEFTNEDQSVVFPDYQYDDNPWNDYRYLLGYETWMRFLPIDLVTDAMYHMGIPMPEKLEQKTNVDYLADWSDDVIFGEEQAWQYYDALPKIPSGSDSEEIFQTMVANFRALAEEIQFPEKIEYTIILPPYSALYWIQGGQEGTLEAELRFRGFLINEVKQRENIRVIDMQNIPEITQLSHYHDLVHFDPEIQEKIVDAIQSGEHDLTSENEPERTAATIELVKSLIRENPEHFSNPIPLLSE